jgi:pyridoxine 5'-phosphate synthase PdxJ
LGHEAHLRRDRRHVADADLGAVLGQMKVTKPQVAKAASRQAAPHRRLRAHAVALAIQMRSN